MTAERENRNMKNTEGGKPVRVLIVDDVKSARDLLEEILTTDPRFQVVGAVGATPANHGYVAIPRPMR